MRTVYTKTLTTPDGREGLIIVRPFHHRDPDGNIERKPVWLAIGPHWLGFNGWVFGNTKREAIARIGKAMGIKHEVVPFPTNRVVSRVEPRVGPC